MKIKQVGPFTVHALTVGEGLPLLALAQKEDKTEFQNALLLATVKRDGQPVDGDSFGDFLPHLGPIIQAAMDLNGFGAKNL